MSDDVTKHREKIVNGMEGPRDDLTSVKRPSKQIKVLKTVVLVCAWGCIGLNLEITGPALKDILLRSGAGYEEVSRAVSGRSVGFFLGAAMGGFLTDKLDPYLDVMIGVCLDGMGALSIVVPYSPYVGLMWFLFVMQGTFEGIINIAGQKLILELWRADASSPMHALHLGFGIGSFIVPQIANPFLAVPSDIQGGGNATNITITAGNISTVSPGSQVVYIRESRIEWPFLIVGLIALSESMLFHYFQFFKKSSRNQEANDEKTHDKHTGTLTLREMIDPGTCAGGDRLFGSKIFGLLFMFFFQAVGSERIYGKFIRSFAIDHSDMDGDSASLLNTEFWISFSAGRFLGFLLARWIPIRALILLESSGGLLAAVLLNIFARDSTLALWILTVPMGVFIAPCFPSGVGWADYHVRMSGLGITFLLLGGSLGGVCYMWTIGHFYDTDGPLTFLYMLLAYGFLICIFAFAMHFVSRGRGNRFEHSDHEISFQPYRKQGGDNPEVVPLKT